MKFASNLSNTPMRLHACDPSMKFAKFADKYSGYIELEFSGKVNPNGGSFAARQDGNLYTEWMYDGP